MVLPFLSLYVSKELGLGDRAAGWMLAIYGVGSCCGAFVGGVIADKFGPFRVQVVSLLLSGLGYIFMARARDFSSLASIVLLTSFVADAFRPANAASVSLLATPETYKRAFSLNRLAINLGFTIGPAVGGILASTSYQFLFWIDGLSSWLAALTFVSFLGLKVPHSSESSTNSVAEVSPTSPFSPLNNRPFVGFLFLTFATFSVFFQLISTFPLFLQNEFSLSEFEIGSLLACNTFGVVAFEMILIQSLERMRLMRMIAWGSFLMCFGFGLLPLGHGYWFAMATVAVWTVGEMLAMPQMLTYVAENSSAKTRSAYMGLYTTCVALAMMIGPIVGSTLYDLDHLRCWHVATIIGVLVCLGFHQLDRQLGPTSQAIHSKPQAEGH